MTVNKFDFNPYDDMAACKNYDGFFDQDGNYYRVKPKRFDMKVNSHNQWAEKYIKEKLNIADLEINPTYSALYALTQIKDPAGILVNCFGFIYYSHEPIYYKPIIVKPDPRISGKSATKKQLDMLFELMLMNNENPFFNPIFTDENILEYNGFEEELGGSSKCKI